VRILDRKSLIATVDAFNEAVLFGYPWQDEAESLVLWTSGRLGEVRGYAGSFALTEEDWRREFRLFTGEKIESRAARAHIIAEEATRMLAIIRNDTGILADAGRISEQRLVERIFTGNAVKDGFYCCGKCSISLWRCLAAGGFAEHSSILPQCMSSLTSFRDGKGGWSRFPFYYTLLLLSEVSPKLAKGQMKYCFDRLLKTRKLLSGKIDKISVRRLKIIDLLRSKIDGSDIE
jgi:hypothetical protein